MKHELKMFLIELLSPISWITTASFAIALAICSTTQSDSVHLGVLELSKLMTSILVLISFFSGITLLFLYKHYEEKSVQETAPELWYNVLSIDKKIKCTELEIKDSNSELKTKVLTEILSELNSKRELELSKNIKLVHESKMRDGCSCNLST